MIDLIFPFHRNDNYLRDALDSIEAARGPELRMIIVDDRIDQSLNLRGLFTRFRRNEYLTTPGGVGYGECLRLATELLSSDHVALMNSDDIVRSDRFLVQEKMLENSEITISKMLRINGNKKKLPSILGEISGTDYHPFFLLLGAYGANATWCMHLDWWKSNAFFDGNPCLDWRIALKSFQHSKISYTSEPLYLYRKHRDQVTTLKKIQENQFLEGFTEWKKLANFFLGQEYSRDVFNLAAMPWNEHISLPGEEYINFGKILTEKADLLNINIIPDLKKILSRRDILALAKSTSALTSYKIAARSCKELIPFGADLVTAASRQAFR